MNKVCKICGTAENLIQYIRKNGTLVIKPFCKKCWYELRHNQWVNKTIEEKNKIKQNISCGTKEGMSILSEDKKEQIKNGSKIFINQLSEQKQKEYYTRRANSRKNSPKEPDRRNKISNTLKNKTLEEKEIRNKKYKETLQNTSEEIKKKRFERKSEILKLRLQDETYKRRTADKAVQTRKAKSNEEKQLIINKRIKTFRYNQSLLTEEEKNIKHENFLNKRKQTTSSKEWQETIGKRWRLGISNSNLKRLEKTAKSGNCFNSKAERDCLQYIKENIDLGVDYQKRYKQWMIDFYLPKYDLYIQFDGIFWHGLNGNINNIKFRETELGKAILKTKEKDLQQNKEIPNLVRITDIEFKNEHSILDQKIKSKIINKIMNLMY